MNVISKHRNPDISKPKEEGPMCWLSEHVLCHHHHNKLFWAVNDYKYARGFSGRTMDVRATAA